MHLVSLEASGSGGKLDDVGCGREGVSSMLEGSEMVFLDLRFGDWALIWERALEAAVRMGVGDILIVV